MLTIAIIIIFLMLVLVLIRLNKPNSIKIWMESQNDDFEDFDYDKDIGRHTYEIFSFDPGCNDYNLYLNISIAKRITFFWQNIPIYIKILNVTAPKGVDLILDDQKGNKIYYSEQNLKILSTGKETEVIRVIVNKSNRIQIDEPIEISFEIQANFDLIRLFKAEALNKKEFHYKILKPMDEVWVGIDPGTTGSCIVSGKETRSIYIEKEKQSDDSVHDLITPSLISINKNKDIDDDYKLGIPYNIFDCGKDAAQTKGENYLHFQSIKKMLGFSNKKEILFKNGKTISVDGKDLSSILIRHLYESHKKAVISNKIGTSLNSSNEFSPQRAVVAIPNNFTATKIAALDESVKNLKIFSEVRYIYESDAAMISYIVNIPAEERRAKELILIFDMGGATINISLSRIIREKSLEGNYSYTINNLVRLGYGIGGDTLDYYLMKILFENVQKDNINPFESNIEKNEILKQAQFIKERIIQNFEDNNSNEIISYQEINSIVEKYNTRVNENEKSERLFSLQRNRKIDEYESIFRPDNLFSHKYLKKYIFDEIENIMKDVQALCPKNEKIDNILFSGRSTLFPGIIASVKHSFTNSSYIPGLKTFTPDLVKSVVARGTCLYGINRKTIFLQNLKTNSYLGFLQSSDLGKVNFQTMIPIGFPFNRNGNGLGYIQKYREISDRFQNDAMSVNFYQVMGTNPEKILQENHKHKYSLIARVRVQMKTEEIGITAWENDNVECFVKEINSDGKIINGKVDDQDICDANDPHYTWMIK